MLKLSDYGLTQAEALMALFNHAKTQGLGAMHFRARNMEVKEAEELLKDQTYFDYHEGRVMKVQIGDEINPRLYDRDNGEGAAERALRSYMKGSRTDG